MTDQLTLSEKQVRQLQRTVTTAQNFIGELYAEMAVNVAKDVAAGKEHAEGELRAFRRLLDLDLKLAKALAILKK